MKSTQSMKKIHTKHKIWIKFHSIEYEWNMVVLSIHLWLNVQSEILFELNEWKKNVNFIE